MKSKRTIVLLLPIFFCVVLFFLQPKLYMAAFSKGVAVWAASVLPSLFPFLLLSNVLISNGGLNAISGKFGKFTRKTFNAPPESASLMLINCLCGYPVAAKTVADMYENRSINDTQALKITTFCSGASPVYAIGTVGINFLGSATAGIILYASALLGQLICGIIYRRKFVSDAPCSTLFRQKSTLGECMYSSLISILTVGGYIALFYMACEMLSTVFCAVLPPSTASAATLIGVGLLEMTNGCYAYATCFPLSLATTLCAFTISFGGVCVFLQCFSYYKKCRLSGGKVLCIKLIQSIISGLICLPLCLLLL